VRAKGCPFSITAVQATVTLFYYVVNGGLLGTTRNQHRSVRAVCECVETSVDSNTRLGVPGRPQGARAGVARLHIWGSFAAQVDQLSVGAESKVNHLEQPEFFEFPHRPACLGIDHAELT